MIQELVPLAGKTTMRIGGQAKYYADILNKDDLEAAWAFAMEKDVPVIVLGNGANTVFADGVINALIIRLKNEKVVGSSRVDLQACKLEYSIVSPK